MKSHPAKLEAGCPQQSRPITGGPHGFQPNIHILRVAGKTVGNHREPTQNHHPRFTRKPIYELLNRYRHNASLSSTRDEISRKSASESGFAIHGSLLSEMASLGALGDLPRV